MLFCFTGFAVAELSSIQTPFFFKQNTNLNLDV